MISLRQVAASCVDVRGGFSVVRDFYGYREERPGALSLRLQLSLLRNPHVHLDVILVGADQMGSAPRRRIDDAIFGAREIFEQIPLGIARVAHHELETADAQGFEILETKAEAKKLTRKFRGSHDDAMDVFFVLEYHHAGGLGNIPGCNKDLYAFNGVVVTTELLQLGSIPAQSGRLLAHELGHALRLTHRDDDGNLMQSGGAGTHLTGQQRNRMLRDCFVQAACWRPDDA